MTRLTRRLFRRGITLHPATWFALLAVFAAFVWLNFNTSRQGYYVKSAGGWSGGIREGFPIPWWDGGNEMSAQVQAGKLLLRAVPYGGWRAGGIALGLLTMFAALVATAALSEWVVRRFAGYTPEHVKFDPMHRPVRIRLLTGLVCLVLTTSLITLNLITTTNVSSGETSPPAPAGEVVTLSETMGWPFVSYVARNPMLVSAAAQNKSMTAQQETAYLERQAPVQWRRSHWVSAGIVLNVFAALIVIIGAACLCEWLAHSGRLKNAT